MPVPYLEAHVPDPDYESRGDYTHIPCTIRNISSKHDAVDIHHSLFEGDRMSFHQILTSRDDELDWMRPIRFYNKNPDDGGIKLFDGVIINTKYVYVGNDYMALEVKAAGWWRELARMEFHRPQVYDSTWSVNEIYTDLVRIANDWGVMKEAVYKYDTSKIPEYSTYNTHYTTATGTEFTFNSVYEGMQTLIQYLDSVVPCAWEFGLRIEALPRLDGISQADVKDYIYILPFPININKPVETTFKRFQLVASGGNSRGYTIQKDYKQLANDCVAIGDGIRTQQIGTAKPLNRTQLSGYPDDNDVNLSKDNDTLASHYLRVTIENPTVSNKVGWVRIHRVEGETNYTEKFAMQVPAGETQIHYTSERTGDGLIHTDCFNFVYFADCYVTVDEITSDDSPWYTTIAGKSINDYGYAGKTIEALWLTHGTPETAQDRVNLIAGKHCRLYHAPIHRVYAPIKNKYTSYDNLIGCTAEFHSPYSEILDKFLITDATYGFKGTAVTQCLMGMRYEYDWEYDDV